VSPVTCHHRVGVVRSVVQWRRSRNARQPCILPAHAFPVLLRSPALRLGVAGQWQGTVGLLPMQLKREAPPLCWSSPHRGATWTRKQRIPPSFFTSGDEAVAPALTPHHPNIPLSLPGRRVETNHPKFAAQQRTCLAACGIPLGTRHGVGRASWLYPSRPHSSCRAGARHTDVLRLEGLVWMASGSSTSAAAQTLIHLSLSIASCQLR
jgi:hypothetical protein